MILTILLIFIIITVVAQILNMKHGSEKSMMLGLVVGFILSILYYKSIAAPTGITENYIGVNYMGDNSLHDGVDDPVDKHIPDTNVADLSTVLKEPEYSNNSLYTQFPMNFEFSQNPQFEFSPNSQKDVPDGWVGVMDGLKYNNKDYGQVKYDIDGHLINGNITIAPADLNGSVGTANVYTDDFWKQQQKPYGDDSYTAATLHLSRKPKEAFLFQSRWGVNSLRPWIAQELDDHANRIWYEDNPDLDQYM